MIDIDPNGTGLPGIEQLRTIVGAIMTVGLILSVLALIVSAIIWAIASSTGRPKPSPSDGYATTSAPPSRAGRSGSGR